MQINKKLPGPDFTLYQLSSEKLPANTFILSSDISRSVLYNPHIAGKVLQDRMEKMGAIFMSALKATALKGSRLSSTCELVLLSGGLFYSLNYGFKQVYGEALPQCFLGIKRSRLEGKEGQFAAYATYENFESLPKNATVLIGDTIATGATLQKSLQHLFDAVEERHGKIEKLIILTLAGSTVGGERLKEVEKKMQQMFPGSQLYFIACEQLFHLMPDGTDLRFLEKDSLMPDETRKYTLATYGEYLGKEMKCAVFDWGTRCKNPLAHYHEFLEFCDSMLAQKLDEKSRAVLTKMKKETEEEIKKMQMQL
ncbi:MAG: hypothetical protein V1492_03655 [Candidatus Micrarchaeota archaeon]